MTVPWDTALSSVPRYPLHTDPRCARMNAFTADRENIVRRQGSIGNVDIGRETSIRNHWQNASMSGLVPRPFCSTIQKA
jgi:hypothetical protein